MQRFCCIGRSKGAIFSHNYIILSGEVQNKKEEEDNKSIF
jgi:hypothetical protein